MKRKPRSEGKVGEGSSRSRRNGRDARWMEWMREGWVLRNESKGGGEGVGRCNGWAIEERKCCKLLIVE